MYRKTKICNCRDPFAIESCPKHYKMGSKSFHNVKSYVTTETTPSTARNINKSWTQFGQLPCKCGLNVRKCNSKQTKIQKWPMCVHCAGTLTGFRD